MKERLRRNLVAEISEIHSRLRFKRSEEELFSQLFVIRHTHARVGPTLLELLKYFPIALVACAESYFRLATKELIDFGEPYLSNSQELIRGEKFDFTVLKALHGQDVTIGDIIAHHVRLNSIGDVIGLMSSLMDLHYRERVSRVCDRWKTEVQGQPSQPIIPNADDTFRYAERAFELRHIFCHEIASAIDIEPDEVKKCIDHTEILLHATKELISQALFPNAPLTQIAMNTASSEEYKKERALLDALSRKTKDTLTVKQRAVFDEANEAWSCFAETSV